MSHTKIDKFLLRMNVTQENVDFLMKNLRQMNQAAEINGLDIQYCMALPRIALASLELNTVSHARASADYAYNFVQWQIGVSSMWSEAIGLAPLKDTFHSTHVQPENIANPDVPGDVFNEMFCDLHAAVATFSRGPVVPGDRMGFENLRLLSKSFNQDGLLLQMSESMKPINSVMASKARKDYDGPPSGNIDILSPLGNRFGSQILTAASYVGKTKAHVILYADLPSAYNLTAAEVLEDDNADSYYIYEGYSEYIPYDRKQFPIELNEEYKWGLYYLAPIIKQAAGDIVILGERDKWVHFSKERIKQINNYIEYTTIELFGAIGEEITLYYASKKMAKIKLKNLK